MRTIKLLVTLAVFLFLAKAAMAENYYIRAGANGANNGTDWANAYTSLPATLVRGSTYYIADGSYSGYTFDDAVSGSLVITLKKATAADHGTSTGWSDTYGDGQATFTDILLGTDYITIDGTTRNSSNWADGTSYGIRVTSIEANTSLFPGVCASNIIIKYVNVGGNEGTTYTGSEPGTAIYVGGFAEICQNWTVSYSYLHNIGSYTLIQFAGINSFTVEYSHFRNAWGKEAIRGQIRFSNGIIRYNQFHNACGYTGLPGEGCTAEIAAWGDSSSSSWDNNQIYGNSFYRTRDENSGGTIVIGGNGTTWSGSGASNTLVYNNTIAGIKGGGVGGLILVNGGSGNICRNNLWYDAVGWGASCNTSSNNVNASSNPFVNYSAGNLHLSSATSSGYSLSSPYNVDLDGKIRGADGVWDIGAFDYVGSSIIIRPSAPMGLVIY